MALNMIKLVVGVSDLQELYDINRPRLIDYHGELAVPVWTRRKPVREIELMKGGSLYRVIKGRIQCRQRILGFEKVDDEQGISHCLIMVSAEMIETQKVPHRPFQGWRYFESAKAPEDRGVFDPDAVDDDIPAELEEDLLASGLL